MWDIKWTVCQWGRIFPSTFSAASNYPTHAPYSHIKAGWLHCQGAQSQQTRTYWQNQWIRTLLEKLTVSKIVKKLLYFLCSSKIRFHVHKRPPLVPILNSVPNIPCLPKDHYHAVLPPTPRYSEYSLPFKISNENFVGMYFWSLSWLRVLSAVQRDCNMAIFKEVRTLVPDPNYTGGLERQIISAGPALCN